MNLFKIKSSLHKKTAPITLKKLYQMPYYAILCAIIHKQVSLNCDCYLPF